MTAAIELGQRRRQSCKTGWSKAVSARVSTVNSLSFRDEKFGFFDAKNIFSLTASGRGSKFSAIYLGPFLVSIVHLHVSSAGPTGTTKEVSQ